MARSDVEKAIRTIRAYCKSRKTCDNCPCEHNACTDACKTPDFWEIGGNNNGYLTHTRNG